MDTLYLAHSVTIRFLLRPISSCLWLAWLAFATGQEPKPAIPAGEIYNSQKLTIPLSDPRQVVAESKLPPGFQLQLVASEPMVQQPIAMAWDTRGRLWIAENFTYAEAKVGFDLELSDRIVILEDTDADGTLDKRTVFWDQGKKLTSIEIDADGVWVQTTPDLLFIPDADHDDRPDSMPQVILTGFAEGMHHNFANGLKFGPDGWLYGRHGITGISSIGFPDDSPLQRRALKAATAPITLQTFGSRTFRGSPDRKSLHCGIWRMHPQTFEFQVVCQGTTNPWGMDWDRYGNLFFINTVIGHLWHAIPNAHLQRMYGEDLDPYVYELLPHIADHVHWDEKGEDWTAIRKGGISPSTDAAGGGHAHSGMMIYQADQWPAEYRHQLFTLNLHGQRINREAIVRQGAGFVGKHQPDMVYWKDPWFRGIELSTGPDGSVYVLDWSDIGECHENDGVHRSSGRIYRVTYSTSERSLASELKDLRALATNDLIGLLEHPNAWYATFARRILCDGKHALSEGDLQKIRSILFPRDTSTAGIEVSTRRLRALWVLNGLGKLDAQTVLALMKPDEPEEIQVGVIRLVADYGLDARTSGSAEIYAAILGLLNSEHHQPASGLVRLYLAALQPSLAMDWRLATALAQSQDLANDRDFPLVMWYGVKDRVVFDPQGAAKWIASCRIPKLAELTIRRLASLPSTDDSGLNQIVSNITERGDSQQLATLIHGLYSGFEGRRKADPPLAWEQLYKRVALHSDASVRERGVLLQGIFGEGIATPQLIQLAKDVKASQASRRSAIESLASLPDEAARSVLWSLVPDANLGGSAATAIAKNATSTDVHQLVSLYGKAGRAGKMGIITALSSKAEWMPLLVEALEKKSIPIDAVDASTWRQFQMVADWSLLQRARKLNPKILELAADKEHAIQELDALLSEEELVKADASRGRVLWTNACANCHKLFGEGGQIGPELTGAQRHNKRYWLENVVAPSAQVAPNYRLVTFLLDDDTILSGVPIVENNDTVTIQTDKEKKVVATGDIQERRPSKLSLMPEGILNPLSKQDKLDLFRYLMSPSQVPTGVTVP
jgi:putative membrane-bound dehydrogenase-like protein